MVGLCQIVKMRESLYYRRQMRNKRIHRMQPYIPNNVSMHPISTCDWNGSQAVCLMDHLYHMCQTQACGANLARNIIIIGPRDHINYAFRLVPQSILYAFFKFNFSCACSIKIWLFQILCSSKIKVFLT